MQDCSLFRDTRQRLGAFNKGRIKDDRCSHAYKYASLWTPAPRFGHGSCAANPPNSPRLRGLL
ncbi:MAG: hypothetical protein AMXMBFR57_31880 [Acidimicrobiia bacterium]|jgi:hypothetical protein